MYSAWLFSMKTRKPFIHAGWRAKESGSAYGIRTRAPALRGPCPNP